MPWPTPQEYNEAVQSPHLFFRDPELKAASPELTALGLPRVVTGAFASVYRFKCKTRHVAVRCFLHCVQDIEQRYAEISNFVMNDNLPYTVDFEFQKQGILVAGQWRPILKMDWVEGISLSDYVAKHFGDAAKMKQLLAKFDSMILDLQAAGIAHGDLQHGNVILLGDELRLVDYDGMYVPALAGWTSNELGHRNYQHPYRTKFDFGPHLDNFSVWSIRAALSALILDSSIWKPLPNDECLMFKHSDFANPASSLIFKLMKNHKYPEIGNFAKLINLMLSRPCASIPFFDGFTSVQDLINLLESKELAANTSALSIVSDAADLWSRENMQELAGGKINLDHLEAQTQASKSELLELFENKDFDEALAQATLNLSPEKLLLARAKGLIKLQKYKQAERDLRKLAQVFPNDFDIQVNLAMSLCHNANVSECLKYFDRAIKLSPNYAQGYFLRAMALQKFEQHAKALSDFEECVRKSSTEQRKSNDSLELCAQCHYQALLSACALEKYEEAIIYYGKARSNPSSISFEKQEHTQAFHFAFGTMAVRKRNYEQATASFNIAKSLSGSFSVDLIDCGLACCNAMTGKVQEALSMFTKLKNNGYKNKFMFCMMGKIYLEDKPNAENDAKACYQEALNMDPNYAYAIAGMGQVLLCEGNKSGAQTEFEKALKLNPNMASACVDLASLLEEGGHYDDAVQKYLRAARLDASDTSSDLKAGKILIKQRQYEKAYAALTNALTRKASADAYFLKSVAAGKLNKQEEAIELLQNSIKTDPNHIEAHFNLASLLHTYKNDSRLAIISLDEVLKKKPDWFGALKLRAEVNTTLSNFPQVFADCQTALRRDPHDQSLRFMIVQSAIYLGEYDRAFEEIVLLPIGFAESADQELWTSLSRGFMKAKNDQSLTAAVRKAQELQVRFNDTELLLEHARACVRLSHIDQANILSWIDEAIKSYSQFCWLEPNAFIGFVERADCYLKLGDQDKATKDFERVLAIEDSNVDSGFSPALEEAANKVRLRLSILWFTDFEKDVYAQLEPGCRRAAKLAEIKVDLKERAFTNFFKAYIAVPALGDIKSAAICWRWKGVAVEDKEQALLDFTKSISFDPGNQLSYLLRAQTLINLERFDEALADLEHVNEPRLSAAMLLAKAECLYEKKLFQDCADLLDSSISAGKPGLNDLRRLLCVLSS